MKKHLFYGAWLLMAAAALTGCSTEDEFAAPEPAKTTWTVVVEADKTDDNTTRALSLNGNTLSSIWSDNDKVYVVKLNGTVPNGYLAPQTTGEKTAKLSTTNLEGTYTVGEQLTLRSLSATRDYTQQKGTIEDVSANHAYMEATVKVTAIDEAKKILYFSNAKFAYQQAFLKLKFTDGTNDLNVKELKISDQTNFTLLQSIDAAGESIYEDLTVTPVSPKSELFIALHNDHDGGVTYTLTANIDGTDYKVTKLVPAKIKDGKYGTTTITINKATEAVTEYKTPLTFESKNGSSFTLTYKVGSNVGSAKPIEYSTNNGASWTTIDGVAGQEYPMTGTTIQVRGSNATYSVVTDVASTNEAANGCNFTSTTAHYVYGNIMSLIDKTGYETATTLTGSATFAILFANNTSMDIHPTKDLILPATTLTNCCYAALFNGCSSLTRAPELPAQVMKESCYMRMFRACASLKKGPVIHSTTLAYGCYANMYFNCTSLESAPTLPATTLAENCYRIMFGGCKNLTAAPTLPATTLAESCYEYMFNNCTALTTAPELPATTLATSCYRWMFAACNGLTSAPELPATTLAESCYEHMFYNCTALTTAPELPATTLAKACYSSMLRGCTSITSAPTLPAPTLVENCYYWMFLNCTSLNYVKCLATDISATDCTFNWLTGAPSSGGTFVKKTGVDWSNRGTDGIPSSWTTQEADE